MDSFLYGGDFPNIGNSSFPVRKEIKHTRTYKKFDKSGNQKSPEYDDRYRRHHLFSGISCAKYEREKSQDS